MIGSSRQQTALLLLMSMALTAAIVYVSFPFLRTLYTDRPLWELTTGSDCDLHQETCRVAVPGGWVELSVSPRPIELLTQLTILVNTDGLGVEAARVDFSSPDMYMGYNRPELSSTATVGQFAGTAHLGICILQTMTWEARLILDLPGGQGHVSFFFPTTRRF